jgi:hypothetical protein
VGAVAILTEFWSGTVDGSGGHAGLYRLCWPDAAGAPVTCRTLEWWPFVQALMAADPRVSWSEARDRWPVFLAARYAAIGAAAACAAVALLVAAGVGCAGLRAKRVLYGLAAATNVLAVLAWAVALVCWSNINATLSNYPLADMKLGYSWACAAGAAGLAAVSALTLTGHGLCLCLCPGACCARARGGSDADGTTELPRYAARGGEEYDDEKWWQSAPAARRAAATTTTTTKTTRVVTGSGTAGSAATSASSSASRASAAKHPEAARMFGGE